MPRQNRVYTVCYFNNFFQAKQSKDHFQTFFLMVSDTEFEAFTEHMASWGLKNVLYQSSSKQVPFWNLQILYI